MEKLKVSNLQKKYGDNIAVDNITFTLNSGECLGLLGINGAGKTSTLKMIYSATSISNGKVFILGEDITKNRGKSKSRLGIVAQEDMLDMTLNVMDNLIVHGICFDIPISELKKRASYLLKFVQLSEHSSKMVSELSGGMRRRVVLARALLNNPEIIILDEPTVGLDIQSRNIIWEKLIELKNQGVSIIVTSHYMNEIEFLSDRILIINSGIIKDEGTIKDLLEKHHKDNLEELFLDLTKINKESLYD